MTKKTSHFSFVLLALDFNLLNISFFLMNYWKRGTFVLSPMYLKLLIAFYIIWLFVSLVIKKFHFGSYTGYWDVILLFTKSAIFNAFTLSFMVVLMGLPVFSRIHVFGTCAFLFLMNLTIFSIYYVSAGKAKFAHLKKEQIEPKGKPEISIFLSLGDFLLIAILFFAINYFKRGTIVLSPDYEKLLLVIYSMWFVTAFITGKFDKRNFDNYYYAMASCVKAVILMTAIMSALIFVFRLFYFSRGQIFGTFIILLMFEAVLYYMYFNFRKGKEAGRDIESVDEIKAFLKQEELNLEPDEEGVGADHFTPVNNKLYHVLDFFNPWLFDFIDNSIDLSKVSRKDTAVLSNEDISDVESLDNNSLRLFINLQKTNNIRWVNRYFLEIYKKLKPGGYLIGNADTIALHRKRFFSKYPKYFVEILYVISFIYRRVLPKLRGINKIYFAITKGRSRLISRAEVLGRLYFCGFKVIAEQDDKYRVCFIAQKVKSSSLDESPSYGPLVKLERSGINGRPINIYKFRTMYPYSEYLQEYVYDKNRLQKGGKFKDDFRVSALGNFMRETWLDELPMLYNWIKGDVKIFGVRPLSLQYSSLYSDELLELRGKVKPGLIPPFYADLPETLEEIQESEMRYLQSYLNEPFKTQYIYLWKAFVNIIIKGTRSH